MALADVSATSTVREAAAKPRKLAYAVVIAAKRDAPLLDGRPSLLGLA
jgi:hypothetical protein